MRYRSASLHLFIGTLMAGLLVSVAASADPIADARRLRNDDPAAAYALIKPLADQGNAEAQAVVAGMYNGGEVPGEKPEEAFDRAIFWMEKAAEQGNPGHQLSLGSWLFEGDLGSHAHADPSRAIPWLEKAAAQGEVGAMYLLGRASDTGKGVPENPAEAARWYRQAIDHGNSGVSELLAALYAAGRGVRQDDVAAFKLYESGARHGSATAAKETARFYWEGRGVPQDQTRSYAWAVVATVLSMEGNEVRQEQRDQLAAKLNLREIREGQDLALGLFRPLDGWGNLQRMEEDLSSQDIRRQYKAAVEFTEGLQVPQNFQKALPVFQKLADVGNPAGLIAMGFMYLGGYGVEPDPVEAYVLYRVARDRGTDEDKREAAGVLAELETTMSPDLIDYARKRSMKWQPKQP